jgi:xylulokinase
MKKPLLLAHDVGTGGNKAVVTDIKGHVLYSQYIPYPLITPRPGWVEQDPAKLWGAVVESTKTVLSRIDTDKFEIIGVSLSAQMLNTLPLDKDGNPLTNMLSWLDIRSIPQAERIVETGGAELFIEEVSNLPTAKDIVPKILWLKEERPEVWKKIHKVVDCKEYLLFRLTGKIAVDWHGASLYFLFDPRRREWSATLCRRLEIPLSMLPDAYPCTTVIGAVTSEAAKETGIPCGTPVVIGAGDLGVAQVGAGAVSPGKVNIMTGTATLVAASVDRFVNDNKKPLWGLCHVDPETWIISGEMETGGGALMWYRDTLCEDIKKEAEKKNLSTYALLSEMASDVPPGSDNLIFTPWLSGERAPVLDHYLKGAFIGLSFGHTMAHMIRSVMEGVGYHLRWIKEKMTEIGITIDTIHAMGGAGMSDIWMQILSDIMESEIKVVKNSQEAGAAGAALTTAVGLGVYPHLNVADEFVEFSRVYSPRMSGRVRIYNELYREYRALYESLSPIYKRIHIIGKQYQQ